MSGSKWFDRWKDSQFLLEQVAAARRIVEEDAGRDFQEWMDNYLFVGGDFCPELESPLEGAFYAWWHALVGLSGQTGRSVQLVPQRQVILASGVSYRVDFSLEPLPDFAQLLAEAGLAWTPIAVEVDGHAFHEKTKEQATYRNQRDRDLQQAGWVVLHISFSEVAAAGADAVGEVAVFTGRQVSKFQTEAYRRKNAR
jgi:hypothetical protein